MLSNVFTVIYVENLQKVVKEVKAYKTDEDLWVVTDSIPNSGGNLALHLAGNIKHFFGAVLGRNGYIRERELEFSEKDLSRDDVALKVEEAATVLKETLSQMSDEDFAGDYPEEIFGETQKTITIVAYMLSHLNYHLGQMNYHRRLLSK
ncbi:MAG: DUF1572 family protein [Pyrinomonadaceae bacterium]|nr:DUF1572 family protein [Pyrinomonadaceae bacterium]